MLIKKNRDYFNLHLKLDAILDKDLMARYDPNPKHVSTMSRFVIARSPDPTSKSSAITQNLQEYQRREGVVSHLIPQLNEFRDLDVDSLVGLVFPFLCVADEIHH